jgi:hypothetical protein
MNQSKRAARRKAKANRLFRWNGVPKADSKSKVLR